MFSDGFLWLKYIVVVVSLFLLVYKPEWLPYLLAVNILVAVGESLRKKDWLFVGLGLLLTMWSLVFLVNQARWNVFLFLMAYLIWNAGFYYSGRKVLYEALLQVLIPVVVGVLALYQEPEKALWYFSMLRLVILFGILSYAMF